MTRAMIVGVGMTRFGRHLDTHFTTLAADAIDEALRARTWTSAMWSRPSARACTCPPRRERA